MQRLLKQFEKNIYTDLNGKILYKVGDPVDQKGPISE